MSLVSSMLANSFYWEIDYIKKDCKRFHTNWKISFLPKIPTNLLDECQVRLKTPGQTLEINCLGETF